MTGAAHTAQRIAIILDEYKESGADIRARVDLQHRNMNVLLVLVTAVTGYLATYSTEHGLTVGPQALMRDEIVVLVPLLSVLINVFVWRHLDHDFNIIDRAAYVHSVLRPSLRDAVGGAVLLDWEVFLHKRRTTRPLRAGPFVVLGKEDVPMLLILFAYLGAGWYANFAVAHYAGHAQGVFDGLLYVASGLAAISLALALRVGREYAGIGARHSDPLARIARVRDMGPGPS